jgi:hypothetical protein
MHCGCSNRPLPRRLPTLPRSTPPWGPPRALDRYPEWQRRLTRTAIPRSLPKKRRSCPITSSGHRHCTNPPRVHRPGRASIPARCPATAIRSTGYNLNCPAGRPTCYPLLSTRKPASRQKSTVRHLRNRLHVTTLNSAHRVIVTAPPGHNYTGTLFNLPTHSSFGERCISFTCLLHI